MSTSLRSQLNQIAEKSHALHDLLERKSTVAFGPKAVVPSILFDAREAGDQDPEFVYDLAMNGIQELSSNHGWWRAYSHECEDKAKNASFGSGPRIDRSLMTLEENEKLNVEISLTLKALSPFLLSKPAQKILEFLIRRLRVHELNADALLLCMLPYHETPLFHRILCTLHLKAQPRWAFLESAQKNTTPVPRSFLVQRCLADTSLLDFLNAHLRSIVDNKLLVRSISFHIHMSFYACLFIETIQTASPKVWQEKSTSWLSLLLHALAAAKPTADWQLTLYAILIRLLRRMDLTVRLVNTFDLQASQKEETLISIVMTILARTCLSENSFQCTVLIASLCGVTESMTSMVELPVKVYMHMIKWKNWTRLLDDMWQKYHADRFLKLFMTTLGNQCGMSLSTPSHSIEMLKEFLATTTLPDTFIHTLLQSSMSVMGKDAKNETIVDAVQSTHPHVVAAFKGQHQVTLDAHLATDLASQLNHAEASVRLAALQQVHQQLTTSRSLTLDLVQETVAKWPFLKSLLLQRMKDENEKVSLAALVSPFELIVDFQAFLDISRSLLASGSLGQKKAVLACLVHACQHGSPMNQFELIHVLMDAVYLVCPQKSGAPEKDVTLLLEACESMDQKMNEFKGLFKNIKSLFESRPKEASPIQWITLLANQVHGMHCRDAFLDQLLATKGTSVVSNLLLSMTVLCSSLSDTFLSKYIASAATMIPSQPVNLMSRWVNGKGKCIESGFLSSLQKCPPETLTELLGCLALESILVVCESHPATSKGVTDLHQELYVALVQLPTLVRSFYLPLFFAIPAVQQSQGTFLIPYWSQLQTSLVAKVSISLWIAHAKASLQKKTALLDYQALLPFCLSGLASSLTDYSSSMKRAIFDILQWLLACYEQSSELPLWGDAFGTNLSKKMLVDLLTRLLKEKKEILADGHFFIPHLQRIVHDHCSSQQANTLVSWMSSHAVHGNDASLLTRVKMSTLLLPLLAPFQTKESLEKYQSLFVASMARIRELGLASVVAYLAALLSVYDSPNGASLIKSLTAAKSRSNHFQCLLDVLKSSQQASLIQPVLQFFSHHWMSLKAWNVPVLEIVLDRLASPNMSSSVLKEWLSQLSSVPGRLVQKRLEACVAKLHLQEEPVGMGAAKRSKSNLSTTDSDIEPAIGLFEILQIITLSEGYALIPLLFEALQLSLPTASQALRLEYYRQLILACLEKIFIRLKSEQHIQLEENALRIDTLVSLLRNSNVASLPTQRHALLALAALAPLAPRLALSAIFPIFIFMGSLSASSGSTKVDDMYTLSMVEQTIATLLPIILLACHNDSTKMTVDTTSSEHDHESEFTMQRVVSMFVESFGHIPAHRRLVLFQGLVESISATAPDSSVELALAYVVGALASRAISMNPKKHDTDMVEFVVLLLAEYEWKESLSAQIRCLLPEAVSATQPPVFLVSNLNATDHKHLGPMLVSVLEVYLSQRLGKGVEETEMALFQNLLSSLMKMYAEFKNDPDALRSCRASLTILWSPQWLSASQVICFFEQVVLTASSELSVQSLGISLLTTRVAAESTSNIYCSCMSHLLAHLKQSQQLATLSGSLQKEHVSLLFKLIQTIIQSDMTTRSNLESKTLLALLDEMMSVPMSSSSWSVGGGVFENFVATLCSLFDWLQMKALPKLTSLLPWLLNGLANGVDNPKRLFSMLQLSSPFVRYYGPCLSSTQLGLLLDTLLSTSVTASSASSFKDSNIALAAVYDRLLESLEPRMLLPVLLDRAKLLLDKSTNHPIVWHSYFKLFHGMMTKPLLLSQVISSYPSYQEDLLKVYTDYGLVVRVALASDTTETCDLVEKIESLVLDALVSQSLKLNAASFHQFFTLLTNHMFTTYGKTITSPIWYTFFSLLIAYFQKFQALFVPYYTLLLPKLVPFMSSLGPLVQTKWSTWNVAMKSLRTFFEFGPKDTALLAAKVVEMLILNLSQANAPSGNKQAGLNLYEKRCQEYVIPCLVALAAKASSSSKGDEAEQEPEGIPEIIKTIHDALISQLARHAHPSVRVQCIQTLMAMYPSIDCGLLLLQDTLPALAEWMEDEQPTVEKAARDFITSVEELLGEETIQSYLH